jgi:hypothetical protein
MIADDEMESKSNQMRQLADARIIANDMNYKESKPRRACLSGRQGDMIISDMNVLKPIRWLADDMIMEQIDARKSIYHPFGVSDPHHNLFYNPTIPCGIKNQTRRLADAMIADDEMESKSNQMRQLADARIIANDMNYKESKPRRGGRIIVPEMLLDAKPRRGDMIIANAIQMTPKPRRACLSGRQGDMILTNALQIEPIRPLPKTIK